MTSKRLTVFGLALSCVMAPTYGEDSVVAFKLRTGIHVKITEAPFSEKAFRVEGCSSGAPTCRINGKIPFGTVGELPQTYLKGLSITYKGQTYQLDTSNMYDAWRGRPLEYPGSIRYFGGRCHDAKTCTVRGLFADAGASFVAEWAVVDGVVQRTVLTDSQDIVQLFMKRIDPPKFD